MRNRPPTFSALTCSTIRETACHWWKRGNITLVEVLRSRVIAFVLVLTSTNSVDPKMSNHVSRAMTCSHRYAVAGPCSLTGLPAPPLLPCQSRLEPDGMTDPTQDPRFLQDPYPTYAAMRSRCPVQSVPTGSGGHISYLVTGYAEAREALRDARLSKDTAAFFAGKGSRVDYTLRWRTQCWPATRPSTPASASW